jgi:Effector-associated domain 11
MTTLNDITLLIQQGRLQPALEALSRLAQTQLSGQDDLRNSIITLLARFNQLQAKRTRGTIADGEAQLTENQLLFGTLEVLAIVREELDGRQSAPAPAPEPESSRIRILFFTANPLGDGQLRLGREIREVEGALARARLRDRFEFIPATATRPQDFLRRILEVRPQFVHFSGHGSSDGVYMLDEDDLPVRMPSRPLTEVFKLFHEVVGCVVLNACYSQQQAGHIHEYIPHVIGTTQKIDDENAIQFATLFYAAIGEGHEIPFAYEFARLGLDLEGREGEMFVMN